MNKTEYIGKLNALYVGDKNCLEELITIYDEKEEEIERLNNKLKDIKSQLDYLETYSSKEDVKRRLDRINKIIGSENNE